MAQFYLFPDMSFKFFLRCMLHSAKVQMIFKLKREKLNYFFLISLIVSHDILVFLFLFITLYLNCATWCNFFLFFFLLLYFLNCAMWCNYFFLSSLIVSHNINNGKKYDKSIKNERKYE